MKKLIPLIAFTLLIPGNLLADSSSQTANQSQSNTSKNLHNRKAPKRFSWYSLDGDILIINPIGEEGSGIAMLTSAEGETIDFIIDCESVNYYPIINLSGDYTLTIISPSGDTVQTSLSL